MDPSPLSDADWQQISLALQSLWLFLGAISAGLGCLLLSQAILPSLVASGHLPARFLGLRLPLYPLAVFILAIVVFGVARAITHGLSALHFYPRFWM